MSSIITAGALDWYIAETVLRCSWYYIEVLTCHCREGTGLSNANIDG